MARCITEQPPAGSLAALGRHGPIPGSAMNTLPGAIYRIAELNSLRQHVSEQPAAACLRTACGSMSST
ncbi:MAG: hypothetical protein NTV33_13845 [Coprothermobacterota bacterium]|nr:hypothetical protein [Coprothermobacterota bacterium]